MGHHDASYKKLFSHPRMMEDFLRAFVREPWVADLDFSTLESLGADFVTEAGELRDGDVVWRVRFRGTWLYVCVLLEFQSKVDPRMALRMMVYVGLLYQKLIRQGLIRRGDKLPLVLPVVLYNGKRRWDAARDVLDLIVAAPDGLERYQPRLEYFLLDEGRLTDSDPGSWQNLSAALFQLERSHGEEEIRGVV
jgi:predicted transposase/invertase (TIGR01784 family)